MTDTSTAAVAAILEGVTPPELLPCPFCGGRASVHKGMQAFNDYEIHCDTCGMCGPNFGAMDETLDPKQDAIAAWNTRAAARDLVPALVAERDAERARAEAAEAQVARLTEALRVETEAKLDAFSTLDAWFDRRKLGHEAVDQAVVDAASGYLRTSRVGGMEQEESDLILGVIQDMARLGLFADLFARAELTQKDRTHG